MWCYQCRASTGHYEEIQDSYGIQAKEWICEDCGQEASDRSHTDWSEEDEDMSYLLDSDKDYGDYGLLGRDDQEDFRTDEDF